MEGYKTILLPVDFSEHCDRAAMHAAWLAGQSGGTVHFAHVVENPLDPVYGPDEVPHWVVVDHANEKATDMLQATAQRCLAPDRPREIHVLGGDPAERLVALAETIHADLIVMSSHGTSGLADLLLGDIPENVSKHAHCPVLLVRVPPE